MSTQDKLTQAEVCCQSLSSEKERLKSTEARLISENEMMHRNQQSRDQLVISLEAIQVSALHCRGLQQLALGFVYVPLLYSSLCLFQVLMSI